MRKLALLSLLGFAIIACNKEEKKPVKDYLVLSGKIDNFKKRNIKLIGNETDLSIKFDRKTGTFADTLRINKNYGYYTLLLDKKLIPLYLTKTEDTGIVTDFNNTDIVQFEGNNNTANSYLQKKFKKFAEVCTSPRTFFSLKESDFIEKLEEYKDALTDLSLKSNLSPEFLQNEIKNIDYEAHKFLSEYEESYQLLSGDNEFKVSENFPKIKEEVSLNEANDYLGNPYYLKIVNKILDEKAKENNKEGEDYYLTYLETIQTEVTDTLVKNELLFKRVKSDITYAENLKEYYDKFIGYTTNKNHEDEITKDYNQLKTVAKGKPAPKFNDFINYNGGTTSLDDLLGHGKYLYIDVWATWCAFCKREIPLLKRLEQEYHGKNIEFVSINVDTEDKLDKWKETIVTREMTGVQLFSGQSHLRLPWAQEFLIKGLPKFILIDPDGNIVNSNAPFPSQGEKLIKMFDDLGI